MRRCGNALKISVFIVGEIRFALAMGKQQQPTPAAPNGAVTRAEFVVAIVLTAWVLLLHVVYLFHAGPLWRDECGTIAFASMRFGEMWSNLQYDNFPPFFEWIAHVWGMVFSQSDFSYRVLGF